MKKIVAVYHELSVQKKASLMYIIANLLSKGLNILTLPLFTRLMSTEQIGSVTTFNSWQNIIYPIVTLSLTSGSINVAMVVFKANRNQYLSACLGLSTVSSVLFLVFSIWNRDKLSLYTNMSSELIVLLGIIALFNPALDLWYAKQRYEYKYKSVAIVSTSITILSIIGSLCVVWANKSANNLAILRIFSQNIVLILVGIIFFVFLLYRGKRVFCKTMWLFALRLSIPLIFHTLAKNILDLSDRLMIGKMCGESEAGIYGTIYTISSMVLILWSAINSALIPEMFENLENKNYKQIKKSVINILIFFGIISFILTLVAPEVVDMLTTKEYKEAVYIIPAIAGGIYLTSVYNIYGNMLLYKKKSINIMIATINAALLNVFLNAVLIPQFGYQIASYTTLISFIILAILQGVMVKVTFKEDILNNKRIFYISIIIVIFNLLCNVLYKNDYFRFITIFIIFAIIIIKRKRLFQFFRNSNLK